MRPYVLVDVRPTDAFKHSHLITAASCPAAKLSRAMAAECKELMAARNHPAAIIVLYDESEEAAGEVAAALEFRGYSNVFVLSGGFALARDKIGGPLVTTATHDSEVAAIGIEEADLLRNRLAATVLPPLTMAAANEWWVAASGEGVAACGGGGQTHPPPPPTAATTSRHATSRSVAAKVKPWR